MSNRSHFRACSFHFRSFLSMYLPWRGEDSSQTSQGVFSMSLMWRLDAMLPGHAHLCNGQRYGRMALAPSLPLLSVPSSSFILLSMACLVLGVHALHHHAYLLSLLEQ